MDKNSIKLMVITAFVLPVAAIAMLNVGGFASAERLEDDVADYYKAKCAMCHGPTALKKYDPCVLMETQVEVILKGKKGEKPPFMPPYEPKGVTADQAAALAEHMIGLRSPTDCPPATDQ